MQTFYLNFYLIFPSTNMHDNNDLYIQTDQQYRITMILVSCHKNCSKNRAQSISELKFVLTEGLVLFSFCFFLFLQLHYIDIVFKARNTEFCIYGHYG